MKLANDALQAKVISGEDVNIESVDNVEAHDLGLGVFDYAPEDIPKVIKQDERQPEIRFTDQTSDEPVISIKLPDRGSGSSKGRKPIIEVLE
ncbi:hypothetical protein HDU83_008080 [Entophlyctis luteolus]|nr:hypothetical protein HDU82_009014 [Entophlyctis luteolus]KAJ3357267.1 hypothetical protein HDU83_008080 [Entophlyctis luteolus]